MGFSFFKRRSSAQDLLMAHADALIAGSLDLDQLVKKYGEQAFKQTGDLLSLAEFLSRSLRTVEPSEQFVRELRRELLDSGTLEDYLSWWRWVRGLPPRTQMAATIGGATLTAGVVWFARRPVRHIIEDWWNRRTAAV